MSVAFTREESAETAAEVELPDRPISPHPNLVTESGLEALANALAESHAVYNAAQHIEDAGERRRALAVASRETRYFAARLRTAQVFPPPVEFGTVALGHKVTFKRNDGRRQAFRIVGEDEADPRNGSISYISPVARAARSRSAPRFRRWRMATCGHGGLYLGGGGVLRRSGSFQQSAGDHAAPVCARQPSVGTIP
jgi:transcription elongation GreA/GreB family factor